MFNHYRSQHLKIVEPNFKYHMNKEIHFFFSNPHFVVQIHTPLHFCLIYDTIQTVVSTILLL